MNLNPKTIIGDSNEPNTVWLATGRTSIFVGLAMFGGVNFAGLVIAPAASYIAGAVILTGLGMMAFGTLLKQNLHRAQQLHEIQLRRSERDKPKPTAGDFATLEAFTEHKRPMTEKEVAEMLVPYHDEREKDDLLESIKVKGIMYWTHNGAVKYENGHYDLREQLDRTVME